jgi:sigma-E factor negative regulatory protein RseA
MSVNDNYLKETLSAVFDGEAEEIEVRRVLKELPSNSSLRDKWRRYEMTSATINKYLPNKVRDFSPGISSAIELEKTFGKRGVSERLIKPLGRFAVAASVATVALLGMQEYKKNTVQHPSTFVKTENIQLNLGSTGLRTSAEFGIPPTMARNVAISNHSQKKSIPSDEILFQSKKTDSNLTREQVQRYLDGLLHSYNQNEEKFISE